MSGTSRHAPAAVVAAALLAGCGDGGREAGTRTAADSAAAPAPAPSMTGGARAASDGAIGVRVEQPRPRELVVYGATTAAVQSLQVSVEDGHRVLFGPMDVPVRGGRFRADFAHEPSDRETVFVYVSDPEGVHQTVVPVARGAAGAAGGPPVDAAPPPPADSVAVGDRRTGVFAQGLESPSFRVRWPRVSPGDARVTVRGEARVARFAVAVVRRDSSLAVRPVAAEGAVSGWRPFSVSLPVEGGFAADDAVVLATGPRPGDRELVFLPVRN